MRVGRALNTISAEAHPDGPASQRATGAPTRRAPPWLRRAVYWGLIAPIGWMLRPVILFICVAAAPWAAVGVVGAMQQPEHWREDPIRTRAALELALRRAAASEDGYGYWTRAVAAALTPNGEGRVDMAVAQAWLLAADAFVPAQELLARGAMTLGQARPFLGADVALEDAERHAAHQRELWREQRRLAAEHFYQPTELIYLPAPLRARYERRAAEASYPTQPQLVWSTPEGAAAYGHSGALGAMASFACDSAVHAPAPPCAEPGRDMAGGAGPASVAAIGFAHQAEFGGRAWALAAASGLQPSLAEWMRRSVAREMDVHGLAGSLHGVLQRQDVGSPRARADALRTAALGHAPEDGALYEAVMSLEGARGRMSDAGAVLALRQADAPGDVESVAALSRAAGSWGPVSVLALGPRAYGATRRQFVWTSEARRDAAILGMATLIGLIALFWRIGEQGGAARWLGLLGLQRRLAANVRGLFLESSRAS